MKSLMLGVVLLATPAWAVCFNVFIDTPACCNRAMIQTECWTPHSERFEYFRPKRDGTCQHVKQTCGAETLPGYFHLPCADALQYFRNVVNDCCGHGNLVGPGTACPNVLYFFTD
jgi:hypothetical protein